MKYTQMKYGFVMPRCPIRDDGTHIGSFMCMRCEGYISHTYSDVVCSKEATPTAYNVESANLHTPTPQGQNAQSSTSPVA